MFCAYTPCSSSFWSTVSSRALGDAWMLCGVRVERSTVAQGPSLLSLDCRLSVLTCVLIGSPAILNESRLHMSPICNAPHSAPSGAPLKGLEPRPTRAASTLYDEVLSPFVPSHTSISLVGFSIMQRVGLSGAASVARCDSAGDMSLPRSDPRSRPRGQLATCSAQASPGSSERCRRRIQMGRPAAVGALREPPPPPGGRRGLLLLRPLDHLPTCADKATIDGVPVE